MRRTLWTLFILIGCGDDAAIPDAPVIWTEHPDQMCLPQGATGTFYRRQPNPRLIAGKHTFANSKVDTALRDPDLLWDDANQVWHVYYSSPHGTFVDGGPAVIRHATSPDLSTWTFDATPALTVSGDSGAWDTMVVESASVVFNPNAAADRRYLMLYTGASAAFPHATYTGPDTGIGAAFSADGRTFVRVPQSVSPHGQTGLVFTGAQAYPSSFDAIVADPEVVLANGVYHLWFSSFACSGASCATVDAKGIGHATSTDGITWTLESAPVRSLLRASADLKTGGTQPSAIYDDVYCRWELWLANDSPATENDNQPTEANNMVGVWHATSTTSTSWSINYAQLRDLVWDGAAAGEHLGLRAGADIARKATGRYMVYTGYDDQSVPSGSLLPTRTSPVTGVMTLQLATRDAPL